MRRRHTTITNLNDGVRVRGDAMGLTLPNVGASDRQRLELEQSDRELREQSAFIGAITTSLGEGVYAVDRAGRLTFMNPAAERILGWSQAQLLGASMHDAVHAPRDGRTREQCELLGVMDSGKAYETDDDVFVGHGGRQIPVAYCSAPIMIDGEVTGAAVTFRDVSEQRAFEHQRQEFFSAAAHDLKTPLTTVKGFAQLIQHRLRRSSVVDVERTLADLDQIVVTATRMVSLINELQDVARANSGERLELDRSNVDLVELVRQVVREQEPANRRFRIEAEDNERVSGQWDAARLRRVVANLISNAIKYSHEDSEIVVSIRRTVSDGYEGAELLVRDSGIGIPAADIPHIFEQFYRAGNVGAGVDGTGIGLAAARRVIEQHGGRVQVDSEEGVGATFTVLLPLDGGAG